MPKQKSPVLRRLAAPRDRAAGAALLIREGRDHERAGRLEEAAQHYATAVDGATESGERAVLAEALRRLADVHRRRGETVLAMELCRRSRDVARSAGSEVLAAEATNLLAVFDLEAGELAAARVTFLEALRLGEASAELRGRIEQNLGILANIRGDLSSALAHYERALQAFEAAGDERGCALAYNNLGMVSADRELWDAADAHYRECLRVTEAIGDVHLRGIALINRTEVFLARREYAAARRDAELAMGIFDQLGAMRHKSDAYKIVGIVYRETGQPALAEARLRAAVALAVSAGSLLEEAEASRELALLYKALGRNQDALRLLNAAYRLFKRLDARRDLVDVAGKVADLEGTYLAVVRDWGQSIESADSYTHGHCERVATYAVAVAGALGLDEAELTTVRLGAYLHDLGKVKTPHEILNKPGRLTDEEFAIMQRHPVDGVEMLAGIDFPWDIKPIIRWHHERYDGTGYPDRLAGEAIPLAAQVICVADVWDALTTTRSYRPAMRREQALAVMTTSRHHWRPDVFEAFMRSEGGRGAPPPAPAG
jgi:putative nucleotidyltransferase with HDIG domain